MVEVVAETLDLSRLPAPQLIAINYETDLAERKARLLELFDAAEIPYDLAALESDPAIIVQEVDNYREMLAKQAINDVYKQTLVAFATGASLDHLAATFHSMERVEGESDTRFRRRIQLEAENKAGGRLSGYKLECLNASIDVFDVGAWVDRSNIFEPTVRLAIMVEEGSGAPPNDLISLVQDHIDQETVRQATDIVSVQGVDIVAATIAVTLYHRRGPDPTILRQNATAALEAMVTDRRQPMRDIPLSAIAAAASVSGVERVAISAPVADIEAGNGQLVHVTAITVESAYTDG
jgi:phage-related baseplate assembly protein